MLVNGLGGGKRQMCIRKRFWQFPWVGNAVVAKATDDAVVYKGHFAVSYLVGVEHIFTHSVGSDTKVEHHWFVTKLTDELVLLIERVKGGGLVVRTEFVAVNVADTCSVVVIIPTILEGFLGEHRGFVKDCNTHN